MILTIMKLGWLNLTRDRVAPTPDSLKPSAAPTTAT